MSVPPATDFDDRRSRQPSALLAESCRADPPDSSRVPRRPGPRRTPSGRGTCPRSGRATDGPRPPRRRRLGISMASPDDGDSGPDRPGPSDRPGSSSIEAEIRAEQQAVDRAYERLEHMRRSAIDVVRHHRQLGEASTSQARVEWESLLALTDQRLQHLELGGAALCFGRIDRNGGETLPGRAASRSSTRSATRSSSTGGRPSPSPSTGRRRSQPDGRGPAPPPADPGPRRSSASTTRCSTTAAPTPSGLDDRRRGRAARRARARRAPAGWATSSPPSRPSRTRRSAPPSRASSSSPAGPAPARPRSRCTGPPTSSTRTAQRLGVAGRAARRAEPDVPALHRAGAAVARRERASQLATLAALEGRVRATGDRARPRPRRSRATPGWSAVIAKAVSDRERPLRRRLVVPVRLRHAAAVAAATARASSSGAPPPRHAQRPPPDRRAADPSSAVGRVPPGARSARTVARGPTPAIDPRTARRATPSCGPTSARDARRGAAATLERRRSSSAPRRRRARGAGGARAHVAGAHRRGARARPLRLPGADALGRDGSSTTRSGALLHRPRSRASPTSRGPTPTSPSSTRPTRCSARSTRPEPGARQRPQAAARTLDRHDRGVDRRLGLRRRLDRERRRCCSASPSGGRAAHGEDDDGEPRTFGHVLVDEAQDLQPDAVAHARPPLPVGLDDARRRPRPGQPAGRARDPGTRRSRSCRPTARRRSDAHRQLPHAGRDHGAGRGGAGGDRSRHRAAPLGAPFGRDSPHRPGGAATSWSPPRWRTTSPGSTASWAKGRSPSSRPPGACGPAEPPSARGRRRRERRRRSPGRHRRPVRADDAKGLEFDAVVLVEPAELAGASVAGLRGLYVALTRATRFLAIVHRRPLPTALDALRVASAAGGWTAPGGSPPGAASPPARLATPPT